MKRSERRRLLNAARRGLPRDALLAAGLRGARMTPSRERALEREARRQLDAAEAGAARRWVDFVLRRRVPALRGLAENVAHALRARATVGSSDPHLSKAADDFVLDVAETFLSTLDRPDVGEFERRAMLDALPWTDLEEFLAARRSNA